MTKEETIEQIRNGVDPIEVSINKWHDIRNFLLQCPGPKLDEEEINIVMELEQGKDNCGLCTIYFKIADHSHRRDCPDCPISQKIGYGRCISTPYQFFTENLYRGRSSVKTLLINANNEIELLESL
tara:strand:- start:447 stop:824 length:378 start_codon:yes stop_codon:yes gene_type:complete